MTHEVARCYQLLLSDAAGNQKSQAAHGADLRFGWWPGPKKAEKIAKQQFGKADLAADGTVAAEVSGWLEERELDVAVTTLGNYRNAINRYVIPYLGGRQLYTLDKRAINDLYRQLLAQRLPR